MKLLSSPVTNIQNNRKNDINEKDCDHKNGHNIDDDIECESETVVGDLLLNMLNSLISSLICSVILHLLE